VRLFASDVAVKMPHSTTETEEMADEEKTGVYTVERVEQDGGYALRRLGDRDGGQRRGGSGELAAKRIGCPRCPYLRSRRRQRLRSLDGLSCARL
jgi:hypothetical protein